MIPEQRKRIRQGAIRIGPDQTRLLANPANVPQQGDQSPRYLHRKAAHGGSSLFLPVIKKTTGCLTV
jgi:hypothetical protein